MKPWIVITAVAACLFSIGCEQKPKNPVAEQGDAMIDAYQRSKTVRDTASLGTIQTAVQAFHAANGRYPQDLYEIKDTLGADYDLSIYAYNPENGSVSLKQ